jgi:hypothetical protein
MAKIDYKNTKEWMLAVAVIIIAQEHKVDIAGDYNQYFKIGISLAKTFMEDGAQLFHMLSRLRPYYNKGDTDNMYKGCLKAVNKITFATFMYYAEKAGIKRVGYLMTYGDNYIFITP